MALITYARRFPVRKGKLRAVDKLWRTAAGSRGTSRIAKLKYGNLRMACNLNEMLQRQFYFFGTYFIEERLLDVWTKFAKQATVVLDVGANAGIYSLAALASQPSLIVHAFEPTPEIADRLRECASLNGLDNLIVHEKAVSAKSGEASLHRCRGELGSNEGMNYIGNSGNSRLERIPTISLDEFCRANRIEHIDLLKLDVQGHEHSVLVGAEDLIKSARLRTIFMELNWGRERDRECPATNSIRLLADSGYSFLNPYDPKCWQEAGSWMRGLSDIVARHELERDA